MAGVFEITNGVLKVDTLMNEDTYHYIEFGRAGHNMMSIYEYGGVLELYEAKSKTPVSIMRVSPSAFTYKGNTVITSSNIGSYNSWGSKNLFFFGGCGNASMNHAQALQDLFQNYSSSLPKSTGLFSYLDYSYGLQSGGLGFFISDYDSTPCGGAFVAQYDKPFYIGAILGTYTEQRIITGPNNFYGSSLPSSSYEGAVYYKLT